MVFLGTILRQAAELTSKQLYKKLMRDCEKLPKEAQKFYKHSVQQSFRQHMDESDPQRIKDIIGKSLEDANWVLAKYKSKKI